jgi:hypothetical protein
LTEILTEILIEILTETLIRVLHPAQAQAFFESDAEPGTWTWTSTRNGKGTIVSLTGTVS